MSEVIRRAVILRCRHMNPAKLANKLAAFGFDGKQPIGKVWTGDDCEFSQPPDEKPRSTPAYVDIADRKEDERIELIGTAAMSGRVVAFLVESDEPGKIERYIFKLMTKFPELEVMEKIPDCPSKGITAVKIKPTWFTSTPEKGDGTDSRPTL